MKKREKSFLKAKNKLSFKKKDKERRKNLPVSYQILLRKRSFLIRSWLTFFIVFILTGLVYFHIFYLQVYENKKYELSSNNNYIKIIPKSPPRGIITDRNGIGLAVNRLEYGLFLLPVSTRKARQDFEKLQQIIPLTESDYQNFLDNRRTNILRAPTLLKSNLSENEIAKILVNKYRLEDISIEPIYNRYYPFGTALPHILGYVSAINDRDVQYIKSLPKPEQANYAGTRIIGKIGLEKYYETDLHGTVGFDSVEVNSTGNIIKTIDSQEPIPGDNLRLAIDLPTQIFAQNLLNGEKGTIVVTNPQTSEIIAIVSNPVYDINHFVNGISTSEYKTLLEDPDKPLYNRATMGVYPPGSTVKPFVAFSGLYGGFVTTATTIWDPGYWTLPKTQQRYRDWLRSGHGTVNLHKSIVESVDTYYYDLAYRMGINNLASYMQQFGFGKRTEIDISEESAANFPTEEWKLRRFKRNWVAGDTPPVGIGQGYFNATPLQLVHALNITLNQGRVDTPHLMLTRVKANANHHSVATNYQEPQKYIFTDAPSSYWRAIIDGMKGVNTERRGSGIKAFAGAKYISGGKSGTAQVFGLNGSNYNVSQLKKSLHDHALFIAFAPYKDPIVSVAIIVENGGGGGKVAGPKARQVIDYYLLHRYPRLNPELTCQQIQINAVEDLQDLNYKIQNTNDLFDLRQLVPNQGSCQINNDSDAATQLFTPKSTIQAKDNEGNEQSNTTP